jgi:hypothetical protein
MLALVAAQPDWTLDIPLSSIRGLCRGISADSCLGQCGVRRRAAAPATPAHFRDLPDLGAVQVTLLQEARWPAGCAYPRFLAILIDEQLSGAEDVGFVDQRPFKADRNFAVAFSSFRLSAMAVRLASSISSVWSTRTWVEAETSAKFSGRLAPLWSRLFARQRPACHSSKPP